MEFKNVFGYDETRDKFSQLYNENPEFSKDISENIKAINGNGKQGFVAKVDGWCGMNMILKVSQGIDYLIEHEYRISQSLVGLADYCIHFCKPYGIIPWEISENFCISKKPFEIDNSKKIILPVMFMEYVKDTYKFDDYIKYIQGISDKILHSTIRQVLMASLIAYEYNQFTHYDLHTCNIMIKQCNPDVVFLYVLDEDNQFLIPTLGNYPIIMDYGFSYCSDMKDKPMYCNLGFTDTGFTSCISDEIFDYKLFLTTTATELCNYRKNETNQKFRKVVYNLFGNLKSEKNNGWDKFPENNITVNLVNILKKNKNISKFGIFTKKYIEQSVELFNSLIILPNQEQDYSRIEQIFSRFLKEWNKIENQILNSLHKMYILKGVIDITRSVMEDYINDPTDKRIVVFFKKGIFQKIDEVTKFCIPKNVNFDILLCSTILMARNMEGFYNNELEKIKEIRRQSYENIPLKTKREIFSLINLKLQVPYTYNENTIVSVFNVPEKNNYIFKLNPKQITTMNTLHPYYKDSCIYGYYKKHKLLSNTS